jgi:hypothetical protein
VPIDRRPHRLLRIHHAPYRLPLSLVTESLSMKDAEHSEPVEECGFAKPSSFDWLRMTVLVSGLSSDLSITENRVTVCHPAG